MANLEEGNQVAITRNGCEPAVDIGTQAYEDSKAFLQRQYINRELVEAKEQANDPNTQWLSEDEFWSGFEGE